VEWRAAPHPGHEMNQRDKNSTHDGHPARAFFGRRKGHPLRARQIELFETLLPKIAVDLSKPAPADLKTLFGGVDNVRLEIGFGGAEHLIAQAIANPQSGFIAGDGYINAIAKALIAVEDKALGNIRLHHGDASALIDWLPAGGLSRVDLLYPDPWPKRKHWKRRFIQHDSLARLARLLKAGGELRFATDIADYAVHALARVLRSKDFIWTAENSAHWKNPWPDFSGTRYEEKAKREGRAPGYFIFRKK